MVGYDCEVCGKPVTKGTGEEYTYLSCGCTYAVCGSCIKERQCALVEHRDSKNNQKLRSITLTYVYMDEQRTAALETVCKYADLIRDNKKGSKVLELILKAEYSKNKGRLLAWKRIIGIYCARQDLSTEHLTLSDNTIRTFIREAEYKIRVLHLFLNEEYSKTTEEKIHVWEGRKSVYEEIYRKLNS